MAIEWKGTTTKRLVVKEKVDGANCYCTCNPDPEWTCPDCLGLLPFNDDDATREDLLWACEAEGLAVNESAACANCQRDIGQLRMRAEKAEALWRTCCESAEEQARLFKTERDHLRAILARVPGWIEDVDGSPTYVADALADRIKAEMGEPTPCPGCAEAQAIAERWHERWGQHASQEQHECDAATIAKWRDDDESA